VEPLLVILVIKDESRIKLIMEKEATEMWKMGVFIMNNPGYLNKPG
jgi:hypothetical protein